MVAAGFDHRITTVVAGLAEGDWRRIGAMYPLSAPNQEIQSCFARCNPLQNLARYQHRPAISFQLGAQDQMIPPSSVQRLVDVLAPMCAKNSERLTVVLEEGVGHEFTEGMWQRSLDWFHRFFEVSGRTM